MAAVPATLPDGFSGLIIGLFASLMALFFPAGVVVRASFDDFALAASPLRPSASLRREASSARLHLRRTSQRPMQ